MIRSLLAAALICAAAPLSAASLTIGTQQNYNVFPFSPSPGEDRYQQVWDAGNFDGLGPIEITNISFELYGNNRRGPLGTFAMSFSTTDVAVNALNTDQTDAGFDSNLGSDNADFATNAYVGGRVGNSLTFSGSYFYDSALGNLLMDIQVSDFSSFFWGPAAAATSNSGGLFSRSHNYGSGFENYGLIATFEYEEVTPVPLPAGAALMLTALGAIGVAGQRRRTA
ncbi:MAG: VPLPA-CTERM sorting domain-containing protein [Pseudomonadota bacterium]